LNPAPLLSLSKIEMENVKKQISSVLILPILENLNFLKLIDLLQLQNTANPLSLNPYLPFPE
jgi:hypothetical protein